MSIMNSEKKILILLHSMRHCILEESHPSPLLGMIQHSLCLLVFHNDLSVKIDIEHWYV